MNKNIVHIQLEERPKISNAFELDPDSKVKKGNRFLDHVQSRDVDLGSYYVIKPLHILSILFGVGRVKHMHNGVNSLPRVSKVMSTIFAIVLVAFGIYHYSVLRDSFTSKSVGRIYAKIYCALDFGYSLLIFTAVVNTMATDDAEYLKILRNIDHVDRQLPMLRRKLYRFLSKKHIILITTVVIAIALLVWNDLKYTTYKIHPQYDYFLIFINDFLMLQFFVDVAGVALRTAIINYIIKKTICKSEPRICPLNNVVDLLSRVISVPTVDVHSYINITKSLTVRELTWLYDKLLDCITMLDNIYGFQTLLQVASVFVMTLQFIVGTIMRILEGTPMSAGYLAWTIHNAIFMLLLTSVCDTLYANINKTSIILNNLLVSPNQDPLFRQQITDFLRLLDSCLTTISACKCFPINFSLLMTFCGAIASHTIIFLQFMNI